MLSKLTYLLVGGGLGVSANYMYRFYNPERSNITTSSQQMIDSYITSHELENNFVINVIKSISLLTKGFYHYSLDTKLQGFNYNSIYLNKNETGKGEEIKRIYCIFSPTEYICGHPEIQHGGATATIIDQSMGYLAALHSRTSIATAELNLKYKRPIKKGQLYVFQGKVEKREGRRIQISGKVRQLETGQVKVESNALFMTVDWDNTLTRILNKYFAYVDGQNTSTSKQNNS